MKKILKKLRKMIRSNKLEYRTDVKAESAETDNTQKVIRFLEIDRNGMRIVITSEDVEPELLSCEVVQNLSEGYGISVGPFINGVAEVSWKLKPYKYYEIDYSVPGWERNCIAYAMVDENGKFLEKFQYTDYYGLKKMRERAERMVSGVHQKPNLLKIPTVELSPEQRQEYRIVGDPRDYDDAFIEALEENAKKMSKGK